MKEPIGKYEYLIDAYLTDFNGYATLPMIGGFMLQAATKHAEERGFGYSYMIQKNRVWVLSRMSIELSEYPKNDDTLIVSTWVHDVNRLFTQREFSFTDPNGKIYGYAKSLWACIDINTRRPTNILDLDSMTDMVMKEEKCPISDTVKLSAAESKAVDKFKIKYSDIDINGHLNSIKYIEHFVDIFPIDLFKTKKIFRIDINYIAEGKYGSEIDILKIEKENTEEITVFDLEMKDKENSICLSKITWK